MWKLSKEMECLTRAIPRSGSSTSVDEKVSSIDLLYACNHNFNFFYWWILLHTLLSYAVRLE